MCEELRKWNLNINTMKAKVLVIGKDTKDVGVVINEERIVQDNIYKYLRVMIDSEGNTEGNVNELIGNTPCCTIV